MSAFQPLSLTGEGRAACEAARQALEATRARLARAQIEVAAAARRSWVDAVAGAAREHLAAHALAVAHAVEEAARERASVGEASQFDRRLAVWAVEQARTAWMAAVVEGGRRMEALVTATGVPLDAWALPADPLAG